MEKLNFVFQTDADIVVNSYKNNRNYLIEYTHKHIEEKKYCILYFTSHNLYFPNNEEEFKRKVLVKDKYEWYQTRIDRGEKHIFLRDIQKQWYLKGINENLNSVAKLVQFLKHETKGYDIITLGSSAGGFAAVLFGSLLKAETIFTFNGRFSFKELLLNSSEMINPIIFREKDNPSVNQFFSLRPFILKADPTKIFYFHSDRSSLDRRQIVHVDDLRMNIIRFRTKHHGVPFLKSNLKYVINYSNSELSKFSSHLNYPFLFSIKIEGFIETLTEIMAQALSLIKKKIGVLVGKSKLL